MIFCLDNSGEAKAGFLVTPNQAMPWNQLVCIYGIITVFSLSIALAFYFQGLVLILPFAGLELTALGIALYVSAWRGGVKEVISISDDKIKIETGRNSPELCYELERDWARVELMHSWHHWYPSTLYIRSHGKRVEVGRFLNEEERKGLAKELKKAINTNYL